ncbi:6-phosphofructokinase [Phormidium sp. CCY1219]|uniref:6-phosphofructokinase n=1 Tax=Phormidium sp. CCY1219 TaxID=2886104 RepID=UPI002D1F99DC|nr:6-phosphofructokinase [Phormidium sp. CCY1219]MEB3827464.1 6-phosphofructokinase [Phormidium sp. CCY1219]
MEKKKRLGILTSGGDSPGMNAAVRGVVRSAIACGMEVYAIYEGYQGMVQGGACSTDASTREQAPPAEACIRQFHWYDVAGILHQGGTIIGTARSQEFRTREGRRQAARTLLAYGINALVAIGGDGSLTGADVFRREWPELLAELRDRGEIDRELAERYPHLTIVGLPASIDNDMYGSDMTIGTDTALHRITEAVDAISSTAASHQRTFVVEVMGRNCGYLALMGALATGADWVMIPECPPEGDHWEEQMCDVLQAGRESGRRDSIVLVAEGAKDRKGNPISCNYIKQVLEERLGEDARVTILGHVQRGGAPTAFDRNLSTLLGHAAVRTLLDIPPDSEPILMGMRGNRITHSPLMHCVQQSHAVAQAIAQGNYHKAMDLRGENFKHAYDTLHTLMQAKPSKPDMPRTKPLRLAILNCSAAAPGMNTAVRAAVRLAIDKGHVMLGVEHGFRGLIEGNIKQLTWLSVRGWATTGGSELGTSRKIPKAKDFYAIARQIEAHDIQGLLILGGWTGYEAAYQLYSQRDTFPAFNIPILCLPASIDNNLPGCELSIGADTALNNIIEAVDKIKQSAVASNRCFLVKVMGRYCGYLAVMSGLATGAERVYINEEGLTLRDLQTDLCTLIEGFKQGKRVGLIICNENAHSVYDSEFICDLLAEEGKDVFQVRQAILGHLQQGGDPSPFDRIQATRLAAQALDFLIAEAQQSTPTGALMQVEGGKIDFIDLAFMPRMVDKDKQRPKVQWWLQEVWPIGKILAQPDPERDR